jgi:hypothetical protein
MTYSGAPHGGHANGPDVRGAGGGHVHLAAIHAVARLADDVPDRAFRQSCIDLLCSYLRLAETRELRHAVIEVITERLRPTAHVSWQGHDFDFSGLVFDEADFNGVIFAADPENGLKGRVSFAGAEFAGDRITFGRAEFLGGTVHHAGVEGVRGVKQLR